MNAKEFGIRMHAAIQAKHKREELQRRIDINYPNNALERYMRNKLGSYYRQMRSH